MAEKWKILPNLLGQAFFQIKSPGQFKDDAWIYKDNS